MNREYKIHAFYVVAILLVVIIGLATSRWGDNPKLVEYLNFAATLTSLVLAVLAIVYAFLSNASISNSVAEIGEAAKGIAKVAGDVSGASTALSAKIDSIPPQLETVTNKVNELLLTSGSVGIDSAERLSKTERDAANIIVDIFVEQSNVAVWVAAYAFFRAFKAKREVVLKDIVDDVDFGGFIQSFHLGVLTTMHATGLLGFSSRDKDEYTFKIENFEPKLEDLLANRFDEWLEKKYQEVSSDTEEQRKHFANRVQRIRSIFSE